MFRYSAIALIALLALISCGEEHTTQSNQAGPPVVGEGVEVNLCDNSYDVSFEVTEHGSHVDWDSVFVDIYVVRNEVEPRFRLENLIHTETPDAFTLDDAPECLDGVCRITITLLGVLAEWDQLRYVFYNGQRVRQFEDECFCEFFEYDMIRNGIHNLAGNVAAVAVRDVEFHHDVACDSSLRQTRSILGLQVPQ